MGSTLNPRFSSVVTPMERLGSILGQGNENRTPHALQLRICDGQPPRDDATVRQLDVHFANYLQAGAVVPARREPW